MNRRSWPALLLAVLAGCAPASNRRLVPVPQVCESPPGPVESMPLPPPDRSGSAGRPVSATALPAHLPELSSETARTPRGSVSVRSPHAKTTHSPAIHTTDPLVLEPARELPASAVTPPVAVSTFAPPAELPPVPPVTDTRPHASAAGPTVRLVSGKRLKLGYQLKAAGGAPVPVELWYTRDGKMWQRDDGPPQLRSPYVLEVKEEGVYGLTLVPCNGGCKAQPPQPGDLPQFWVAVDWTRPIVSLLGVETEPRKHTLSVRWSANDEHLGPRPITLSFAEQASGPWTPLAANLKNTGSYWGATPSGIPPRCFIRVEAADQSGNVGEAHTLTPVVLDASTPQGKIQIIGVEFNED